jgi:hypothetical protein
MSKQRPSKEIEQNNNDAWIKAASLALSSSSAKWTMGGTVVTLLWNYESSRGIFEARPGDLVFGAGVGFLAGLAWNGAEPRIAKWIAGNEKRTRKVKEIHPSKGRRSIYHDGRNIPINFEAALVNGQPGFIARESILQSFRRLIAGKRQPRIIESQAVARPPEIDEFKFYSQGLQLLESDVLRFLQNAWRNNQRGRGLSERRWCGKNRETLPHWFKGEGWYWAMMNLLANTEEKTHVQIVAIKGNGWKMLLHSDRATYALLRYTVSGAV